MSGRVNDALDHLSEADKLFLASCLPSEEVVMLGWATPVLAAPEAERPALVACQLAVVRELWDDPEGWCARALELAADAAGADDG